MLPRNHPDRIQISFDDRRLVANAGLILPATLARRLGLPELVRQRLELGDAPGRANTGDKLKLMTLVTSALAGGDCIDDAEALRTGATSVTRPGEPGAAGAAHFLRETVGRVRYGGARGQLTVRAGSGFYTHSVVAGKGLLAVSVVGEGDPRIDGPAAVFVRARAGCARSVRDARVGGPVIRDAPAGEGGVAQPVGVSKLRDACRERLHPCSAGSRRGVPGGDVPLQGDEAVN